MSSKKEILENTIEDLISNFLYYDRKGDEDLPVGMIQQWIKEDKSLKMEIQHIFFNKLENMLN